ncbi:hypothetical protein HYH03_008854 [Edaphochlamys debaryana]|uniref:PsbP C-terminal domain-containing protein n=1 Tax=Edaphochlamys debaryana TaxID=47281 RepID=A0A835XZ82_9CHLO|nr:hypothetical protein HYH03_008854 [Edaphochlamys debaryana]|eukprot:KAG2492946.1 hypothetical protein HYH03_008854 [Edaphochlamys debaryana]
MFSHQGLRVGLAGNERPRPCAATGGRKHAAGFATTTPRARAPLPPSATFESTSPCSSYDRSNTTTLRGEAPATVLTRRHAAAGLAAALALALPSPARAENGPLPKTCLAASDGLPPPPPLQPYSDPQGRFRLAVPCGWRQVTSLLPDSNVLASFYSPEEPGAETLAVYRGAPPEGGLGSPEEVAAALARVAPNGIVQESYGVTHGGRSYAVVHVQFGGNTAGMFGAAREFRSVVVVQGVQYTLRVTSTRYRYLAFPEVRSWLHGAAEAFEVTV